MRPDFAAFILTHGRPDRVVTIKALRNDGYTGRIYLVIDDEDPTGDEYRARYGDDVITFSKRAAAPLTDTMDALPHRRGVVFARNAIWQIARDAGVRYFIELDDDYNTFRHRRIASKRGVEGGPRLHSWKIRSLDRIFEAMIHLLETTSIMTVAMAQGGDYNTPDNPRKMTLRKAMNSFVCDVERPFYFLGRINEDVNAYILHGSRGQLYFTYTPLQLEQIQTQANPGGLTGLYLDSGTYVKSFFTVIAHPSSTCVRMKGKHVGVGGESRRRLHHSINWRCAVPSILHERHRKPRDPEPARVQREPARGKRAKPKAPP